MLRMAGIRLHPGMRVLLGIVLMGVGLLKHHAAPLIVIGAVVGLLGLVSMAGGAAGGGDDGDTHRDRRR